MDFLSENHILHFDIKCDNFLLEPKDKNISDEEFYNQRSEEPNFDVRVADFGEAKVKR
jgi:serine/threonine protein kinase